MGIKGLGVLNFCHHTQGDKQKGGLQCVLGPCDLLNRRKATSLLVSQLWVPHIHDEYQPEGSGVLPHLVLKRVVEDEHLAFFPRPGTEKHGFL